MLNTHFSESQDLPQISLVSFFGFLEKPVISHTPDIKFLLRLVLLFGGRGAAGNEEVTFLKGQIYMD